jgi:transcriptional regulator with XRE-family HTH domain
MPRKKTKPPRPLSASRDNAPDRSTEERDQLIALGTAVRTFREQRTLNVSALAASVGVEPTAILALEAGRLDPPYDLLLSLADALDLHPAALILRVEELGRTTEPRDAV